jgi:hypothetical protein
LQLRSISAFSVAFGEPLPRFEEVEELTERLGEPLVQPKVSSHVADVRTEGSRCQENVALVGGGFFSGAEFVRAELIIFGGERKRRHFDIWDSSSETNLFVVVKLVLELQHWGVQILVNLIQAGLVRFQSNFDTAVFFLADILTKLRDVLIQNGFVQTQPDNVLVDTKKALHEFFLAIQTVPWSRVKTSSIKEGVASVRNEVETEDLGSQAAAIAVETGAFLPRILIPNVLPVHVLYGDSRVFIRPGTGQQA